MIDTSSDHATVLAEAIVPPEGYRLHHGLITTYSLDLHTLLALPAHLILPQEAGRAEFLTRPVALLDALQRARDRLTVCCEPGATHAPRSRHLLFSLLEPVIHEVPEGRLGVASSLPNVSRYSGGALGGALLSTVVAMTIPASITAEDGLVSAPLRALVADGMRNALLVAAGILVLGAIAAFRVPRVIGPGATIVARIQGGGPAGGGR